jgi:hypothetical protein
MRETAAKGDTMANALGTNECKQMMSRYDEECCRDKAAWEQLRAEVRQKYLGQYVGLAQGRIVAASKSFDDVVKELERIQPKPVHMLVFPAEEEPPFAIVDVTHTEYVET